jgi:transposase
MFGGWTMPAYFFRSEPGAAELRRLARRESGRVCQRVLMIANMLEGMEHEEAARLAGLSRSAAYEWHNRYEEDGVEGLRDRPRPGRQPRVDAVTSARFKERIVAGAELERDGVVAFRGVDAQRILKEEFDVDCSLSSTYRLLHRIKLSWLAPRPRPPQVDGDRQINRTGCFGQYCKLLPVLIIRPSTTRLSLTRIVLRPQENAMLSESDIYRAAHLMLHQYGDDAEVEAAQCFDRMLRRDDFGELLTWFPGSGYGGQSA